MFFFFFNRILIERLHCFFRRNKNDKNTVLLTSRRTFDANVTRNAILNCINFCAVETIMSRNDIKIHIAFAVEYNLRRSISPTDRCCRIIDTYYHLRPVSSCSRSCWHDSPIEQWRTSANALWWDCAIFAFSRCRPHHARPSPRSSSRQHEFRSRQKLSRLSRNIRNDKRVGQRTRSSKKRKTAAYSPRLLLPLNYY